MAILSKIRRWHFREHISLREIAKRTGLSRNTVRRYLKQDILEPTYPQRHTPSKLDDYASKLAQWLADESKKSRKQRRSLKQLHADLCLLGYAGSYDRVAAFARSWRQQQIERAKGASKRTYIPLRFAPGEAFQFEGWQGKGQKLQKLS